MKVNEAVSNWVIMEALKTYTLYCEACRERGVEPGGFDVSTVQAKFLVSDPVRCSNGHDASECPSAFPARPVLRISGKTFDGQNLWTEEHLGDLNLVHLIENIVVNAGGNISVDG